jgi:hypothetical protein
MRLLALSALLACTTLVAGRASAFTYESPASKGCHERIAGDALRAARAAGRAPALGFSRDERALANDVPFTVPDDLDDLAGVTLLIGVRDNDLHGRGPADLETLAMLHGDESVQQEHCLRATSQDGHAGTIAAVAACREFIRSKFIAAIDAPAGARVDVKLVLAVRGQITASLPAFYVHIGAALHALQDSFTHTFRTADGAEVTVVLNWVEHVAKALQEGRDGPPHLGALDKCDDSSAIHTNRRQWATEASIQVMKIATDPTKDRAAKLAAFDATLDRWLGVKAGCTEENRWCDAPELALNEEGCGCRAARGGTTTGLAALFALFALVLFRRYARFAPLAVLLVPSSASADETPSAFEPCTPTAKPEEEGTVAKGTKRLLGEPTRNFGLNAAAGASFDSAAFAMSLGARYRLTDLWLVGVDAEWNPWGSPLDRVHRGVFNAYATGIKRWTLRSDTYALRTSLHVGTSTMLFDLYGVPYGTTGLYTGISFVGVEIKLGSGVTMIFEPAEFALPVPQLRGLFGYPQYRFTIALQWGAAGR